MSIRWRRGWTGFGVGVALLALSMLASACTRDDGGGDPQDELARRIAFRDVLKRELGDRYESPLPPLEQEQFARGAQIYTRLCESCHGLGGRGNGVSGRMLAIRPPDLADSRTAGFFSDRAKLRIVERGAPGTPMIGWEQLLTEEECAIVLQYLLDLASSTNRPGTGEVDG